MNKGRKCDRFLGNKIALSSADSFSSTKAAYNDLNITRLTQYEMINLWASLRPSHCILYNPIKPIVPKGVVTVVEFHREAGEFQCIFAR